MLGSLGPSASPALSPQWWPATSRPQRWPSVHVFPRPRGAEPLSSCMPLSTPPTPAPGAPVRLARLSCSWGLGLLPWLCDGTVGVRGPFNSSQHSCVRVCALVRHHVRTVSVLGWGPMAAQTPLFWKEQPGKTPPSTHPVSICSCHSPLDSLFIEYVLVSSLPLWLILIHLIYRGGRQKATKNVLELFFLGDTASLGP